MKNTFLFLLISLYSLAFSQGESDIAIIRTKVESINSQSKSYQSAILGTVPELSTEGSEIVIYTKELNDIKLIRETYYGEMGKTVISDYIENNQPIFVFKENYVYKLPITNPKFNAEDFTKKEERFYLKNGRIIRWMTDKKILKTYPKNAAAVENNMIEYITALITKFNKENKE